MTSSGKRSLRSTAQGQTRRRRGVVSDTLAAALGSVGGEASSSTSQLGMMNVPDSSMLDPSLAYGNLSQMMPVEETVRAPVAIMSASAPQMSSRAGGNRHRSSSLRMGGCSIEELFLNIPSDVLAAELERRRDALQREITYQERNPPKLPPSQVQDLPPKPFIVDFLKFPDGISDMERLQIEARNNVIAAEHQRIDRQRNNQAAKKSRQARLESLNNTRALLNEKTAECAWFRMKVLSMGGSTAEWDEVPDNVKDRLIKEIDDRVKAAEAELAEAKKREDAKKRADRNKRKAEVRKEEEEQRLQSSQ